MTETSTKTWHELAEQNQDFQDAVDKALADYAKGKDIHAIMRELKETRAELLGSTSKHE